MLTCGTKMVNIANCRLVSFVPFYHTSRLLTHRAGGIIVDSLSCCYSPLNDNVGTMCCLTTVSLFVLHPASTQQKNCLFFYLLTLNISLIKHIQCVAVVQQLTHFWVSDVLKIDNWSVSGYSNYNRLCTPLLGVCMFFPVLLLKLIKFSVNWP